MKIKINNEALAKAMGYAKDHELKIEDKDGVPKEHYWRNRLRDSAIDNCITVINPEKKVKS